MSLIDHRAPFSMNRYVQHDWLVESDDDLSCTRCGVGKRFLHFDRGYDEHCVGVYFSPEGKLLGELEPACLPNEAPCSHASLEDYEWHHGYGKYVTGSRCLDCGARRSFKSMGLWISAEDYARDCRDRWDD